MLAAGRDGLMLPIRGQACYREGATATVSVYDRRGRRLGTVYLGRMPEPGQETLSRPMTALVEDVLRRWAGPLPRLAYITDAGYQQTRYYRRVLSRMRDPRQPRRRLNWAWVIDYYHACEYIYKMADALFSDPKRLEPGAEDGSLVEDETAWSEPRVALGGGNPWVADPGGDERKQYRDAYNYLRNRIGVLDYCQYRRDHLPIGSGVTEAACKTVFTQRLKQSGMTWKLEGGQWIVDLRVIQLSGLWSPVYQAHLQAKILPETGNSGRFGQKKTQKGRVIDGMDAIAPLEWEEMRSAASLRGTEVTGDLGPIDVIEAHFSSVHHHLGARSERIFRVAVMPLRGTPTP